MTRRKSNINRATRQATRAKWYRNQETSAQREARLAQYRESAALRRQRETSAQRDDRRSKLRSAQRKRLARLRQQQATAQRNIIFDGLRERNARETTSETKGQKTSLEGLQSVKRSNDRHEASFISTTHAVKTPFVEVDLPSDSVVLIKVEPLVLEIEYEDTPTCDIPTIETDPIKEEPSD